MRLNDRNKTRGVRRREEGEEMGARIAVCQVSKNKRTAHVMKKAIV
jgi:hypothetical protein